MDTPLIKFLLMHTVHAMWFMQNDFWLHGGTAAMVFPNRQLRLNWHGIWVHATPFGNSSWPPGSWKVEEIQESLAELCPGNWAECQDWGSSSGYLAQLIVIGEVFSTFTDWAAEGDNTKIVPVLGDVPF